ncbi:protoglobin domain-containing protein [Aneurinibacillus sp. REN35]|uniref:protoglobin domain-containing protein n=1 Tax=Aneurinibacillus sp. REN35 TaxID=3237286 RepID=UPI00352990B4
MNSTLENQMEDYQERIRSGRPNIFEHITIAELETHKRFLNLTPARLRLLAENKELISNLAQELVEVFYEKLMQHEELKSIIHEHSTVERLGKTFVMYCESLATDKVDLEYVQARMRIGNVHNRVRLLPSWYIAANQVITEFFVQRIAEKYARHDLHKGIEIISALSGLMNLDTQIIMESYIAIYIKDRMRVQEEIKHVQRKLVESGETLAATAEETSSSASEMFYATEKVYDDAQLIEASAENIVTHASEGEKIIDKTFETMGQIEAFFNSVQDKIMKLSESSSQIESIIEFIQKISKMTNILALNAAIEASRAGGEHGRSFMVVANEVKKLADDTSKALTEISELVQISQSNVQEVVGSLNGTTSMMETGTSYASQAKTSFQDIMKAISASLVGIKKVTGDIKNLEVVSQEMRDASSNVAELASELAEISREINRKINQA